MRLTVLLIIISTLTISAKSYSQKVNLSMRNVPIESVFTQIREQTGCSFLWTEETLKGLRPVSVSVHNVSLTQAVQAALKGLPLAYNIHGNVVYIEREVIPLLYINPTTEPLVIPQHEITGEVVDAATGSPLIGVTIREKGSSSGTTTDVNGKFSLNVSDNSVLQISFLGYTSLEVPVNGRSNVQIKLSVSTTSLNQLVVVGYGTEVKKDLTGAVNSFSSKELTRRQVASTSNLLEGLAPGVTATQQSGKPGGDGASIRIRGIGSIYSSTAPLILVDNVPMSLDAIDPNDIESISILKDAASTAIFGSRAANGVILVTTKRGSGKGIKVKYNGFLSIQGPTNLPKKVDAITHMEMINIAHQNTTGNTDSYVFDPSLIEAYKTHPADNFKYFNTDWEKAILTNTGLMHNQNVSISEGTDKIKFFGSGTYLNQQGLTANTFFEKYDFRMNTDIELNKKLTLHGDFVYNTSTRHYPGGSSPEFIIRQMLGMPAIGAGKFGENKYGDAGQSNKRNPIGQAEHSGFNESKSPSLVLKTAFTYVPIKGLKIYGFFANNNYSSHSKVFLQNYAVYDPNYANNTLVFDNYYPGQNSISEAYSESRDNSYLLQGTYSLNKGKHSIKILGGFQAEDVTSQSFSASRSDLPSDEPYLSVGTNNFNNNSNISQYGLASFYSRINYSFSDKYLLELNERYDGSSRFSQSVNKQWGSFPSASVGWIMTKEKFFEPLLNIIDFAKIRTSYGILGNQNIGNNYPFVATLNNDASLGYYFNNSFTSGVAQLVAANPDISWELSKQFDAGLDMELFNSLSLTFDYYKRDISKLLLIRPIPNYVGLGAPYVNAGSMTNRGWELEIGYRFTKNKFNFNIRGNLSNVVNKVINLGGQDIAEGLLFSTPGYPLRSYYGYIAEGLFQSDNEVAKSPFQDAKTKAGDIKYKDVSGPDGKPDGKINGFDRVILGNNYPHYEYGINLNASWEGFDINVLVQGVAKRLNYISGTGAWAFYSSDFIATAYQWQRDYWTPNNPDAKYPRLTENLDINWKNSSYWLKNGAYMRIKNVQLGYTVPSKITQRIKINSIRFYISGQNLLTVSHYVPGFDPEINNVNGEFYPIMKTYTVGMNIDF